MGELVVTEFMSRDDVPDAVRGLKDEVEGDILIQGSATLAQSLAESGLIDRYNLMVFPVVLGEGKRLFAEGGSRSTLELAELAKAGTDGVLALTYRALR